MKNIVKSIKGDYKNISAYTKGVKSKLIELIPDRNNHYVLFLKMEQLKRDNYRLTLNNGILTLMMFKSVDFEKPLYSHHINLSEMSEYSYDEVVDIEDFRLPDKNYFIIHHEFIPFTGALKVTLGRMHSN